VGGNCCDRLTHRGEQSSYGFVAVIKRAIGNRQSEILEDIELQPSLEKRVVTDVCRWRTLDVVRKMGPEKWNCCNCLWCIRLSPVGKGPMVQRPMRQVARPPATDRTANSLTTDYCRHDADGSNSGRRTPACGIPYCRRVFAWFRRQSAVRLFSGRFGSDSLTKDSECCSSRLFACSASFARTSWLSDRAVATASTAVRAKSAKIAKAREEQQHHEWCPHVFTGGVVLPVDHAAPAHVAVPGDQRARGEDAPPISRPFHSCSSEKRWDTTDVKNFSTMRAVDGNAEQSRC